MCVKTNELVLELLGIVSGDRQKQNTRSFYD